MLDDTQIIHNYVENKCHLKVPLVSKLKEINASEPHVENFRNCDVFIEEFAFYLYADVKLFKFHSKRSFDLREMKNLILYYNTKDCCYEIDLSVKPAGERIETVSSIPKPKIINSNPNQYDEISQYCGKPVVPDIKERDKTKEDLWKLKRITDNCQLQLDREGALHKLEANFSYGFAGKFKGKLSGGDFDKSTCRVPEPHLISPLQRTIDRQIDEMKNFSREQYKLNFVDLQVTDGHMNPLKFKMRFDENILTRDEERGLHNLTCKPEYKQLPAVFSQTEVDCGLLSILLAICYDMRTNAGETNCESGWTRSVLSATLSYFEPFENYKTVLVSFMRRVLVFPLYRNYDLSRLCVQDAIDALNKERSWIIKQLLVTRQHFADSDCNREFFNCYYIDDYIRYVSNEAHFPEEHMRVLARNTKNVLFDIYKKHLYLNLVEIETELLKELISEMQIDASNSEGDDDNDDDGDDEDDDDDDDDDDEDDNDNDIVNDEEIIDQDDEDSNDSDNRDGSCVSVEDEHNADDDDEITGDGSSSSSSSETENSVIEQISNATTAATTSATSSVSSFSSISASATASATAAQTHSGTSASTSASLSLSPSSTTSLAK